MLYHKYKPLASRVYCTGLALLLVLDVYKRQLASWSHSSCGCTLWDRR